MKKFKLLLLATLFVGTTASAQVYGDDEKDYIKVSSAVPRTVNSSGSKPFFSGQEKFELSGIGDNWFASVKAGIGIFDGAPMGCDDIFGRTNFTMVGSVGKWHSKYFGTRLTFQGFKFKNAEKQDMNYQNYHADLMLNVSSFYRTDYDPMPRWNFMPYVGFGVVRNSTLKKSPFGVSYGFVCNHRISDRVYIEGEIGGTSTYQTFDGLGKKKHFGDNLFQACIGVTVGIGKQGFKRKNSLSVLNTDGDGVVSDLTNYPKNDYKGLNDLRARLANGGEGDSLAANGNIQLDAPILFFFKINSTVLIDKQQKVNIKEIAGAVKANDLRVKIVGAADSRTGSPKHNMALGVRRARYIAKLLIKAGVPKSKMIGFSRGGIDLYKPYTANRHTCVILYKE